jgi:hypothetical protein
LNGVSATRRNRVKPPVLVDTGDAYGDLRGAELVTVAR